MQVMVGFIDELNKVAQLKERLKQNRDPRAWGELDYVEHIMDLEEKTNRTCPDSQSSKWKTPPKTYKEFKHRFMKASFPNKPPVRNI